jgi:uncharacterized protein (TIGR00369 family)
VTGGTPACFGRERSKTITWFDPAISAEAVPTMSGIEFLQAIAHGTLPPPPIARHFDFSIEELREGSVVFECLADESTYNPIGLVHGGLVCTLADTVAGCAVQTTLAPGQGYTSIDLSVSYLRPVTRNSGRLRGVGRVVKPGRRVAFAEAEIFDGSGALVAAATSSCLVFPVTAP